jgi:endonuclease G
MDKKTTQVVTVATVVILLIGLLVRALVTRDQEQPLPPPPAETRPEDKKGPTPAPLYPSLHLTMGNPSGASEAEATPNNFLMRKPYFALSYNNERGTPNWVSWCLKETDLGPAPRGDFFPDPDLPRGFHRITPRDYTGTGFDRGHLCPRSDRTATNEMANATFVMTNIVPQSPQLNQRGWADFEDYCRDQVKHKHQVLYVVAGPQGVGGEGSNGRAETIAGGKVTVPAKCWKVVLAVDGGTGGDDDIGRVGANSRVIAIVMPNDQTIGHDWPKYRTSVKEVETLTGFTFFDRVPVNVIDPLKSKVDDTHIAPVGKTRTGD